MKYLRIAGLLAILLTATGGVMNEVHASAPITCWARCGDGVHYYGECWSSLEECCSINQMFGCPEQTGFVDGTCTDGENYCPYPSGLPG